MSFAGHFTTPKSNSKYYRAGSVLSQVFDGNNWHKAKCPRVRERLKNGKSKEVHLSQLAAIKDTIIWEEQLMRNILCGVSYGNMNKLNPKDKKISKASLSKLWEEKASVLVENLQNESLEKYDLVALMIDGVWLSKELSAVVALGFDKDGHKKILGFRIGTSENETVCVDLLNSLRDRGLKPPTKRDLLVVLDGSKALDKATKTIFGTSVIIQRCLMHKERNVLHYTPKKLQAKVMSKFKYLREACDEKEAKKVIKELKSLLKKHQNAINSIEESETELTAIHKLSLNETLQMTFRSTNSIENAFRNVRRHIGRVTNWKERTCVLWVGSGLILAQETFKRIKGYEKMSELMKPLKATSLKRSEEDKNPFEEAQSFKKSIDNNKKTERLTA
ncbi:MAG: transposase [Opitutales bacterium]